MNSGQIGPGSLGGTESEFEFGYASLVVLGSQRVSGANCKHQETLKYLLSHGVPPDVPDICGHTALHHTMIGSVKADMMRTLIEHGANVDQQERYGGVPLLIAFRTNRIDVVDLLMEAGAKLDIPDADGITPNSFYVSCGPQVTAAVTRWIRKRNGEEALLEEKTCGKCGKKRTAGLVLKHCSRCRSQMYCSSECQRPYTVPRLPDFDAHLRVLGADWKTHKPNCHPFSDENTVTMKPFFPEHGTSISTAALNRRFTGMTDETIHSKDLKRPSVENKDFILKVQIPFNPLGPQTPSTGPMLVYNNKNDFRCMLRYEDNPDGYKRLTEVVKQKGVGGAKAYFPAELKMKDQLVIKITDVLAEQSF